jgi:hypothetical protein
MYCAQGQGSRPHCFCRSLSSAPAQWGHGKRKNIQPVPEIFPQTPFANLFIEMAAGACNHPHIDLNRFGTSQPLKLTILEHPEQFGLQFQRQFTDLIQKMIYVCTKPKAAPFCLRP